MTVYRYKAMKAQRGEFVESGVVIASDKAGAKAKLREHGFGAVQLEVIRGVRGFWKRFKADIK